VRIPAHCCGLVGLKPTRGRTPVGPAHDGWPFGYTSQHIVSRTVRDSAALLDITRGHEDGALFFVQEDGASFADAVSARLPRLRIALATASPYGGPVHPDCVAAAQRAARLCETLGHRVEEAEPPVGWEAFADAFAIGFCLTRDYVMNQLEERSGRKACLDTLEPLNWAALQYSRTLTSRAISEAATTFNTVRRSVARFFAEHDVLITPTAARPAWRLGELSAGTEGFDFPMWGQRMLEYAPFTQLQNVTGQPAISLPLHHGAGGLPAGAHLVGRFGEEGMLLSLAADLEEACPWAARRPAIHVLSQQGAAT
jgi:Asp-tRNA(Asn)/Glu-tRNA(Gln) amidotransferase A subunit family amidase